MRASLLLGTRKKPSGHQPGERFFRRALHDPHVRGRIRLFAQGITAGKNASGEAAEGGARDTAQTILGVDDAIRVLQTAREEFGLCTREL